MERSWLQFCSIRKYPSMGDVVYELFVPLGTKNEPSRSSWRRILGSIDSMADYKEKFDELHRAAKQKARELDEKLGVSGIVEEGTRVAGDAARRGARTIANGAEQLRAEAGRIADDPKLRDNARRAASEAKRHAKDAGKIIRDAAGPAGKKAGEVFDEAANYVGTAAKVAGKGMRATRASAAATAGIIKA